MRFDGLHSGASFKFSAALAACVALVLALGASRAALAQKFDDGDGAFRTGKYRDLFAEQGHPPAETRAKIEKAFVEELWRTPVPVGDQRYFDGMLYIMSLLHCSGNFRVIGAK